MSLPANDRASQTFRAEYTYRDYAGELHTTSSTYTRLTYPAACENVKPLAPGDWHLSRDRSIFHEDGFICSYDVSPDAEGVDQ